MGARNRGQALPSPRHFSAACALAALALLALGLLLGRAIAPAGQPHAATPAKAGAAREVAGVPVSFPHTRRGAAAAVAAYQRAFATPAILRPGVLRARIEAVAAPDYAAAMLAANSPGAQRILDDGVDIDHPNQKKRIWRNPNSEARDRHGRDFFLPDNHPDHYNPRPKLFTYPYDQLQGNDIHGTPCAGLISTVRDGAFGVAPMAWILPVKVFHADSLAQDARVADAIRYAAVNADILSCSWSGPSSPDIELAIEDAGSLGREGRGSAVFCATGNEGGAVGFPASHPEAIGVGASTDQAQRARYSNYGPEVDFVAPSSGGVEAIYTTDVVNPLGRGFNIGDSAKGGADGRHTNEFGGTSSATPLAAGVGALALSARPRLDRTALRGLLRDTADRIGPSNGYDGNGRSDEFGFGRINAHAALEMALDHSVS